MKNPAIRRYMFRLMGTLIWYVCALVVSVGLFAHIHPTGALAWLLALLPALGIIGQLAVFGLYLGEETDEFQRNLQIQAMLWGIGGTLAFLTVWGFLEIFVHLRHFDLLLVYPLYCGLTGVSLGLVKMRYR
jgi:hypothetical protein